MSTCPSCLSANDDQRRFCGRCGVALGDGCCGFINPPESRYCGGCGRLRPGLEAGLAGSAAADVTETGPIEWGEVVAEAAVMREGRAVIGGPRHLDQGELDSLFEG